MPAVFASRVVSGWELEHSLLHVQQIHGDRLVEGAVSWNAGLTLDIAAISASSCIVNGTLLAAAVAAGQVTLTAADPTNPRRDAVWVNNAGVYGATAGTPAAETATTGPALPDIGSVSGGGTVTRLLRAEVYVPANAITVQNQITDKRQRIGRSVAVDLGVHSITGTATLATNIGDHGAANIGTAAADGSAVMQTWRVPVGFARIITAVITGIAGQTGNLRYSVATDSAATGEARTTNSDSIAATTQAVVADQIIDIDVTAALDGIAIAAGDEVGLTFNRVDTATTDTITDFYVLGLKILYWMTGN